jgi:hypothetical protein
MATTRRRLLFALSYHCCAAIGFVARLELLGAPLDSLASVSRGGLADRQAGEATKHRVVAPDYCAKQKKLSIGPQPS